MEIQHSYDSTRRLKLFRDLQRPVLALDNASLHEKTNSTLQKSPSLQSRHSNSLFSVSLTTSMMRCRRLTHVASCDGYCYWEAVENEYEDSEQYRNDVDKPAQDRRQPKRTASWQPHL
ncbi:hypothetical protein P3342_001013 [Pyrenophora teres f. teres]|nr:hypothetical protein P3342_001013 [Pyrenophora teres f. teres]